RCHRAPPCTGVLTTRWEYARRLVLVSQPEWAATGTKLLVGARTQASVPAPGTRLARGPAPHCPWLAPRLPTGSRCTSPPRGLPSVGTRWDNHTDDHHLRSPCLGRWRLTPHAHHRSAHHRHPRGAGTDGRDHEHGVPAAVPRVRRPAQPRRRRSVRLGDGHHPRPGRGPPRVLAPGDHGGEREAPLGAA